MKLQILGTGCSRCKTLTARVEEVVATLGAAATIEKVENIEEIVKFGVMSTPALALDGKVLFSGRVPTVREIGELINTNSTK
jgi:small redox-active disulfide protein 2